MMRRIALAGLAVALGVGTPSSSGVTAPQATVVAYTAARIIDGSGAPPIDNGVLVVEGGRIRAVGPRTTPVPRGARTVDLTGRTIAPGFINAHGHITDVRGLKGSPEFYTPDYIRHQLLLYARYGITTVFSLGGDEEAAFTVRDEAAPGIARLFLAGRIVNATAPEPARAAVDAVKASRADIVKIRVDDNLGTGKKMPAEAYRVVIEQAHKHGLRLAAHIFYLQDAKDIVAAGGDFIAHSIRDQPVDRELIDRLKARDVCVCPTLMRDVSTFVYESRPSFLDDPFFTRAADPAAVEGVQTPQHQASNRSASAVRYKAALEIAKQNLVRLRDAGVRIAMGTDSGPAARFQGYFEHLELEQMVSAGLTPMQTIVAATSGAARCMQIADRVGTLAPGLEADFLVFAKNPLDDIRNTRTLESVWIRGNEVKR
jgi:imidazolonepropionase-like amidohydrolase